jgi:hypothetical protein
MFRYSESIHLIPRIVDEDPQNLGIHYEEISPELSVDVIAVICQLRSRGSDIKIKRSIEFKVVNKRRPEITLVTKRTPSVTFSTFEVNPILKCSAFGVPEPQIRWEKVGQMNKVCP